MASGPPLIALKNARLSYGGPPLFEALDIGLLKGERACLVGRNGSGKSSLLKALAGRVELDAGERFLQPGCVLGYLPQDPAAEEPNFKPDAGVLDYVAVRPPAWRPDSRARLANAASRRWPCPRASSLRRG